MAMVDTNDRGTLCVMVGGQYGSEGKGAVAAHVASDYAVHVRVGSPNAGHTIWWRGAKHVMQSIPCGWVNPAAKVVIGRGALLNMRQLAKEVIHVQRYYPDFLKRLYIDESAGVLDERFHEMEGGTEGEMHRRIGSTGEGVGPARVARINRDPSQFRQFRQVADEWGLSECVTHDTPAMLARWQDEGMSTLVEGTQGSALSLLHSFWPYCTSVDTNAAGIASEVGIAPSRVTDVLMVCRTYPIRVAGNSGPMENETSWRRLSDRIGREVEERTTVTKKVRRVAEWDDDLFRTSFTLNGPSQLALTFCDYIDPDLYGCTDLSELRESKPLMAFLREHGLMGAVRYFGTGPSTMVEV